MINNGFDWLPENLEEAKLKFKEMYEHQADGDMIAKCMYGILDMRMRQGQPFKEAYKHTLYDYLKTPESERK